MTDQLLELLRNNNLIQISYVVDHFANLPIEFNKIRELLFKGERVNLAIMVGAITNVSLKDDQLTEWKKGIKTSIRNGIF